MIFRPLISTDFTSQFQHIYTQIFNIPWDQRNGILEHQAQWFGLFMNINDLGQDQSNLV